MKKTWTESIEKIGKKIKWGWIDNWGQKYNGEYQGSIENGKPNGFGRWKGNMSNNTIEGQWKDGQLHGKVVENSFGFREEYEVKNRKRNGKCIKCLKDGRRF